MLDISPTNKDDAEQIGTSVLKYLTLWRVENIQHDIRVEFSTRMTRSLGRVQPVQKVIRLNIELRASLKPLLEEVICHELAHVAAVHLHGPSIKPHGKEWQALVRQAGYEPIIRMRVKDRLSPNKRQKTYRHLCPVCQSQRIGRKPMTRWRCKTCVADGLSGELQIEEIP